jgi:glucose-6-phosphate isomerase
MQTIFNYLKQQIEDLRIFNILHDSIDHIKYLSNKFVSCEKIIVIGTGGSSLGGKCLVNFEALRAGKEQRVTFLENIDSRSFMNTIRQLDPMKTGIIVISKSGKTTESLMLLLTIIELWPNFDYANRGLAITDLSEDNDLRTIAKAIDIETIDHDKEIGGRFSVFSVVGLLPALLENCNISAFRDGAKSILTDINSCENFGESKLFCEIKSIFNVLSNQKVDQHVLISYSDFMEDYGKWFAQLMAESLGKTAEFGITPIRATGTIDQHSLLQLFLAGPSNKLFTIITQNSSINTPIIGSQFTGNVVDKLKGHRLQDLMRSHQMATIDVLKEKGFVRVIECDEINLFTLGKLMMQAFVETVVIAKLANINPFDQPAVEKSKKLAIEYLSV